MASEMLAQKAVENVIKESKESGSEPPAAIVGKGTADSPSNGGNLPGTNTQPGVEPPSGQKGAGIAGDPYDQGNTLEQDQVPGGKLDDSTPASFPEHQGSGAPHAEHNVEEEQAATASKGTVEQADSEAADKSNKLADSVPDGGKFHTANAGPTSEAKRKVSDQRDVSPGTLPDGSHAQTAEARGKVYEVSKLSKFKNKLGFGKG